MIGHAQIDNRLGNDLAAGNAKRQIVAVTSECGRHLFECRHFADIGNAEATAVYIGFSIVDADSGIERFTQMGFEVDIAQAESEAQSRRYQ